MQLFPSTHYFSGFTFIGLESGVTWERVQANTDLMTPLKRLSS